MARFKLQIQDEFMAADDYFDHSEHGTYDEALAEACNLFDSNMHRYGKFSIIDTVDDVQFIVWGYTLMEDTCPVCGRRVRRYQMERTFDCHGIPFRLVCEDCFPKVTVEYDGEYYDESDEVLWPDL